MQRRRLLSLATVLVMLAVTGCATSSAATGESLAVQLQVDNNLRGISGVSIYLLTETGGRRSLGPIESNNRRAFDRDLRAGDYQLVATLVGADDIVSERFRVDTAGLVVFWSLQQNQITFAQR